MCHQLPVVGDRFKTASSDSRDEREAASAA